MSNCKKHEKIEEPQNTWFDDLVKYLVSRNINEKRIMQNYSDVYMMSFIYITYQIPRFKDLLEVLCEISTCIDRQDCIEDETCDADVKRIEDAVTEELSYRKDARIDELFVKDSVYLLNMFDDFRDCVQVLAVLDQQCGDHESILESKKS
jgi:hypothetical protein